MQFRCAFKRECYNPKHMRSQVEKILHDSGFSTDKPLLVGVSGGADSLCLLHLLSRLEFPLVTAHLDHGLRPESAQDAQFVAQFAAGLGLPVVSQREDVAAYAQERNMSVEEAARELRYTFLFQQAQENGAQAVLVAHHADDQVESVLMHLLRGAGMAGLRGMQVVSYNPDWHADIPLVRPLLGIWRREIDEYCQAQEITPREDQTNQDTTYFRNRLRHELIPSLEDYNPNVRQAIWRTADTLAADYQALQQLVEGAWLECQTVAEEDCVRLQRLVFNAQPLGLKRAIMRQAIGQLRPGLRDIGYEAVEGALAFAAEPSVSGEADLVDGLKLEAEGEWLIITEWHTPRWQPEWPYISGKRYLDIPGSLDMIEGWTLEAEVLEYTPQLYQHALNNADDFQAWLDAEAIDQPVFVRAVQDGDKFSPLGMKTKSMKVGDYFTNIKLPRRARRHWPLLLDQIGVLWIPGQRIDHRVRLKDSSRLILKLKLYRQ